MTDIGSAVNLDDLVKRASAPADTARLESSLSQFKSIADKQQNDPVLKQKRDAVATAAEGASEEAEKKYKKVGSVDVQPWTQKPPEVDPARAFGSPGAIFASLASAFTRQPMQNSLNAAAAAMNAVRSNDLFNYKEAFNAWQTNTNLAFERHKTQMQDFDAAIKMGQTNVAARDAALKAYASQYGDQFTAVATEAGMIDNILKAKQSERTAAIQMMQAFPALQKQGMIAEAALEMQAARKGGDPKEIAEAQQKIRDLQMAFMPVSASVSTDPKRMALAAFIQEFQDAHEGQYPSSKEISDFISSTQTVRSAPAMAMRKFMQEHPDANSDQIATFGANYQARSKSVSAFATGKQGDIVRSFSTVAEHLESLDKAASALDNGDFRILNSLANKWAKEQGKPEPTDFKTVKDIVAAEIVKAIVGAGGTGGDRDEARSVITEVGSPEQLHGAINKLRELVHGQLVGLEKQYVDTTTLGSDDPESKTRAKQDFRGRLSGKAQGLYDAASSSENKFEIGKTYTDAAGNKAIYRGPGQWEEVK